MQIENKIGIAYIKLIFICYQNCAFYVAVTHDATSRRLVHDGLKGPSYNRRRMIMSLYDRRTTSSRIARRAHLVSAISIRPSRHYNTCIYNRRTTGLRHFHDSSVTLLGYKNAPRGGDVSVLIQLQFMSDVAPYISPLNFLIAVLGLEDDRRQH